MYIHCANNPAMKAVLWAFVTIMAVCEVGKSHGLLQHSQSFWNIDFKLLMELHNGIELQDSIPWVLMFLQLLYSNLSVYIYSNGPKLEEMSFLHIHNRYPSVGSDGNPMSWVFFRYSETPISCRGISCSNGYWDVTTRALHWQSCENAIHVSPLQVNWG